MDLLEGLAIIGNMFEHIQEEHDVPAIAPRKVQKIYVPALYLGGKDRAGPRQSGERGIGQSGLTDRKDGPLQTIGEPPAATTAHIDHTERPGRPLGSFQVAVQSIK